MLVLDEPGEHLDMATADAIVADALDGDRGTLLITHRLAGLEAMDEIVVLDAGRVVERGTHAELLRRGGRYAESGSDASSHVDAWARQLALNDPALFSARRRWRPICSATVMHRPGTPPR